MTFDASSKNGRDIGKPATSPEREHDIVRCAVRHYLFHARGGIVGCDDIVNNHGASGSERCEHSARIMSVLHGQYFTGYYLHLPENCIVRIKDVLKAAPEKAGLFDMSWICLGGWGRFGKYIWGGGDMFGSY